MTKQVFLDNLKKRLAGMPETDLAERLSFYGEMIDDLIEEGAAEEEAVAEIGTVESVAQAILSDYPLSKIVKERIKPKRRLKTWEIVLIAVGSPVWLSLLIALFAVLIALYIAVWAVIVAFWAIFVSFIAVVIYLLIMGIYYISASNTFPGICLLGAAAVMSGLTVFVFFGCNAAGKGVVRLTKKIATAVKNHFAGKGEQK